MTLSNQSDRSMFGNDERFPDDQIPTTLSSKFSWSHFVESIRVQNTMAKFYGYVQDCKIVATLSQQLSFKYRLQLAIAQAQVRFDALNRSEVALWYRLNLAEVKA